MADNFPLLERNKIYSNNFEGLHHDDEVILRDNVICNNLERDIVVNRPPFEVSGNTCDSYMLGIMPDTNAGETEWSYESLGECTNDCSSFTYCGDGVVQELLGEECDGSLLEGLSCRDFGFNNPDGLICHPYLCDYDTYLCSDCGNGIRENIEDCDDGNEFTKDICVDAGSVASDCVYEDINCFDEKNMTEDIEATWHLIHEGYKIRMSFVSRSGARVSIEISCFDCSLV